MLSKPAHASDSLFTTPHQQPTNQLDSQIHQELNLVATKLGLMPDEVNQLLGKAYTSASYQKAISSKRLIAQQTRANFRLGLRQAVQEFSYSALKPLEGRIVTYLPTRITRHAISGYVLIGADLAAKTYSHFAIPASLPNEEQTLGDSYTTGRLIQVYLASLSRNPVFICSQPLPALRESSSQ